MTALVSRSGSPSWRSRVQRALVLLAVVASAVMPQPTSPIARAVDVCASSNCATLTLSFTGSGSAHVVDDWGQLDCSYNGSSAVGTCDTLYVWAIFVGSLDVTLTATASPSSCIVVVPPFGCSAPGASVQTPVTLNNGDAKGVSFEVRLAAHTTLVISPGGDGKGRVTSKPAGIDCQISAGTASGTCSYGWYYSTPGLDITLTATPTQYDYACFTTCGAVGEPQTLPFTAYNAQTSTKDVAFRKGHPIVTVAVSGHGTIVSNPSGISCPTKCSHYFPANSPLSLKAAAKTGYVFKSWTGACSGSGSTCHLALGAADLTTTALFGAAATPAPTTPPAATSPRPSPTRLVTPSPSASAGSSIAPAASDLPPIATAGSPAPGSTAGAPEATDPPGQAGPSSVETQSRDSTAIPIAFLALGLLVVAALVIGILFGRRGNAKRSA